MDKRSQGKKIPAVFKWIAGIAAIFLLLIAIAFAILNRKLGSILTVRIQKEVIRATDSLYRLDFAKLEVSLFSGDATLSDIKLVPNLKAHNELKAIDDAPDRVFNVKADKLVIEGAHPLKAWLKKEVEIDSIVMDAPVIEVDYSRQKSQPDSIRQKRSVYSRISKTLRSLHIGSVSMNSAEVKYTSRANGLSSKQAIGKLDIRISDILIDSLSESDQTRFYLCKDIFARIKKYTYQTADKMYTLQFGELSVSTRNQYAIIKNLTLTPRYSPFRYSRQYSVQKDWHKLEIMEIRLDKVNFKVLDNKQQLVASTLSITKPNLQTFLNKSLPPPLKDKWINFPHITLRRLKLPTRIDTVFVQNGTLRYSEFNPASGKTGTIFFTNVNGNVTPVANDSLTVLKREHSAAQFSGRILGRTQLNLSVIFDLTDPSASFSYSGNVKKLDLTDLNPMNRVLSLAEIKSGYISKLSFRASGNRFGCSGSLEMYYNNLKVSLLKKEEESGELKKRGLLSLIANAALILNDNPSKGEPLRIGKIEFKRLPSSSFFNTLWKGLLSGIQSSIGLGETREKAKK